MTPGQVVALFSLAADQIEREGKTYGEWVLATTDRFKRIVKAVRG